MSSVAVRDAVTSWALPALLLTFGLLPPHVHPLLHPALALGALLLVVSLLGAGRIPSPRGGAAAAALTGAGIALLSSATALDPSRSWRLLVVWFAGGTFFLAARRGGGPALPRRAVAGIVLLATILSAHGLLQVFVTFPAALTAAPAAAESVGPPPVLPDGAGETPLEARLRSGRAVGTLGLPALLASILLLGLPLAAAEGAAASGSARVAWIGAALLQGGALAATRSIGGFGALALALAFAIPAWSDLSRRLRLLIAGAALAASLAILAPRIFSPEEGSAARAAGLRAANWRAALSMIVSHPILGVGPDNYGVAFPAHRTWASNETQHAHNSWLEAASDLGLPAALLVGLGLAAVALAASSLSGSRRDVPTAARWRDRALALAAGAWVLQSLFDFTAHVAATLLPFLVVAGLLIRRDSEAGDPAGAAASGKGTAAGRPARLALLAAAVLAAGFAVPDGLARYRLAQAVDAAGAGEIPLAARRAGEAAAWNPRDSGIRAFLAEALVEESLRFAPGDPAARAARLEAAHHAEEAVRLDPHTANRRAALARARAAVGDRAGAYAAMAAAARLNPFRPSYAEERDALRALLAGDGDAPPQGAGP